MLIACLVAVSAGYFGAQRTVVIEDEGIASRHTTFAPDVGSAIQRLGITLDPGDLVSPGAGARLGESILILRSKPIVLALNGGRQVERVTGLNVAQVLAGLGVELEGAFLSHDRGTRIVPGLEILVRQPAVVTVVHDGTSRQVVTNVWTAGELLRQIGVELSPHDRVEPNISMYPANGSTITVVRVREATERVLSGIPFKRVVERTNRLEYGVRRVGTTGREGVRARIYHVVYEDGRLVSKELVGTEVVEQPRDEVTLIGTRRPVFRATGGYEVGKATWFHAEGLSAAHRTLPKGTVVRVTNLANGRTVDVVIRDRGPYGDGRIIDLSDVAFAELAPLRTGVLNVKIEW